MAVNWSYAVEIFNSVPLIPGGFDLKDVSTVVRGSEPVLEAGAEALNTLKEVIVTLATMFGDYYDILHILDWLPEDWMTLIMIGVGIVITLRVYSFGKDLIP